jgi:hypothetical protein
MKKEGLDPLFLCLKAQYNDKSILKCIINVFLNVYEFSTYLWKSMLKLWKKDLINVSRSCDYTPLNPSGPCDLTLRA